MASFFVDACMQLSTQLVWLFILALPVACVAWTVTHEEIFREPRQYCERCSRERRNIVVRKFFYIFTCEFCFSFYVSAITLVMTRYKLLFGDWRGYVIACFSLMWIANVYMGLFFLLKMGIRKEGMEVKKDERQLNELK